MVKTFLILLLIPVFCFGQYVNDLDKVTVSNLFSKDSVNVYVEALNGASALTPYKMPLDTLKLYLERYIQISLTDTFTYHDDIMFPLISGKLPASNYPDFEIFVGATQMPAFDKNTNQTIFSANELLHKWAIGTDIDAHIHWAESTADTGFVCWGVEVVFAMINDAFVVLDTLTVTDEADSVAHKHHYADLGDIDMSSYSELTDVSGNFVLRVYRDASNAADTYPQDAFGITIGFHYEIDSMGSRSEVSK